MSQYFLFFESKEFLKRLIIETPVVIDFIDKDLVNYMIDRSVKNPVLTEKLLYDVRFDNAWKPSYTKKFNKGKKKPTNRAGWVIPLQGLCEKVPFLFRFGIFAACPEISFLPFVYQSFTSCLVPA